MFDFTTITTTYQSLPPSVQAGLGACGSQLFRFAFKDGYEKIKNCLKPNKSGVILAKSWNDFRESYLKQEEDDVNKLKIFECFFNGDAAKEELSKIFSGDSDQIDFDKLEDSFIERCRQHGKGRVPDFDFVQTVSDVVDSIEALASQKPEFREQITESNIGSIRRLLEGRGIQRNLTLAKRIYIKQLIEIHNKLRFSGIPDLKEKKVIPG